MKNTMRETMKKKNKIRFSFTRKPEPGSQRQRKAPHRGKQKKKKGRRGRRREAYYLREYEKWPFSGCFIYCALL